MFGGRKMPLAAKVQAIRYQPLLSESRR